MTDCVISSVTLSELNHIKDNKNKTDELRHQARKAIRAIERDKPQVALYKPESLREEIFGIENTNDVKIICSALQYFNINCYDAAMRSVNDTSGNVNYSQFELYSEDTAFREIASQIFGITTQSFGEQQEEIYKGYQHIKGDTNFINEWFIEPNYSKWNVNEYLIIENTDTDRMSEMRFDGTKFVNLKLPSSNYIKGKNSLQRCALDALYNKDISCAAIMGSIGSGKTFMNTQMAKYHVVEKHNQNKILGVREAIAEGAQVGYLKGDFANKTEAFFAPIKQQMTKFEFDDLVSKGTLETNIPFFMKGTTYPSTIVLVDEAEDLTKKQIKLIGTRLGENSRIFFSGDYKQSAINSTTNNALVEMCNELKGNSNFACVVLDEDVRSDASKMFANIFQ